MLIRYVNYSRFRNCVELEVNGKPEIVPMHDGTIPSKQMAQFYALKAAVSRARKAMFGEKIELTVPTLGAVKIINQVQSGDGPVSIVSKEIMDIMRKLPGTISVKYAYQKED